MIIEDPEIKIIMHAGQGKCSELIVSFLKFLAFTNVSMILSQ